jgi:hypothetical protein
MLKCSQQRWRYVGGRAPWSNSRGCSARSNINNGNQRCRLSTEGTTKRRTKCFSLSVLIYVEEAVHYKPPNISLIPEPIHSKFPGQPFHTAVLLPKHFVKCKQAPQYLCSTPKTGKGYLADNDGGWLCPCPLVGAASSAGSARK